MNYELALKLKNAGFPQKYEKGQFDREILIPTLEELIEACGELFESLDRPDGHKLLQIIETTKNTNIKYIAFGKGLDTFTWGPTPLEAVANLWLALHKHD